MATFQVPAVLDGYRYSLRWLLPTSLDDLNLETAWSLIRNAIKEKNETREAFFGSLLNNPVNDSADINPRVSGDLARVNNSAPSSAEITLALNSLKTGNADGTDQLPSELFKFAADDLASPLLSLFGKIWTSTYILSDWKDAIIIPVHKKGDKALCSNYLGISLTNSVFKALEIVMRKRIEPAYSPLRARISLDDTALADLGYADDISLVDDNIYVIQRLLDTLNSEVEYCGLKINVKNSEICSNQEDAALSCNGAQLNLVENFTYLRSSMQLNGDIAREVKSRIGPAAQSYKSLEKFWYMKDIQCSLKLNVYNACITGVLLFSCET
ncbi:uncharacterized protein LOC142346146 [Convolutriloba macropyga]|uniref:uncharacterized protein LOC142346146 n=1 Tax=Convolutriloba macropyga TaxID=536237 RepID=UPI003F51C456